MPSRRRIEATKLPVPDSSLESLRHSYRPSKIILLLVGESPPPHKGFFYDASSTEGSLSRNTRKTFEDFFGTKYSSRQDFLDNFKSRGCYLMDLFKDRGKTVYEANRREKQSAFTELNSLVQEVEPRIVISVLKRTGKLVEDAVRMAPLAVRYESLPYPTRNYVREYSSGLRRVLAVLRDTY